MSQVFTLYNMRNNEPICKITQTQISFLQKVLIKENEDNTDFYINQQKLTLLHENLSTEEDKIIIDALEEVFSSKEHGGFDCYFDK